MITFKISCLCTIIIIGFQIGNVGGLWKLGILLCQNLLGGHSIVETHRHVARCERLMLDH